MESRHHGPLVAASTSSKHGVSQTTPAPTTWELVGVGGGRDPNDRQFDRICHSAGGLTQAACRDAATSYANAIGFSGNFDATGYCCIFFDDGTAPGAPAGWSYVDSDGQAGGGAMRANGVGGYECFARTGAKCTLTHIHPPLLPRLTASATRFGSRCNSGNNYVMASVIGALFGGNGGGQHV